MSRQKRKRSDSQEPEERSRKSPVVDSASFEGFDPEEDAEYGDFEDLEANDVASEQDQADDRQDEEENAAIAASNSGNRPPTRDELRSIKEASELYKSNTFKLAIDEMLPNIRPKASRVKAIEDFLHQLHSALMNATPLEPKHPLEAEKFLLNKGVAVPFPKPRPSEDTAWKVGFSTPNGILLVGSWATKSGAKSPGSLAWVVDMAVEMPAELFQEKDYLDNRFFHKRAFFLAAMAYTIKNNKDLNVDVTFDSALSDTRMTTLLLSSRQDSPNANLSKLDVGVRILLTLPDPNPISTSHLSPSRCNIRLKHSPNAEASTLSSSPTPIYNSDLLLCTTQRVHLLQTHEAIQSSPSLRDALALLHVWANQRGYSPGPTGRGCVAGFERRGYFWTAVMHAVLLGEEDNGRKKTGKASLRRGVGKGISSYQLFRAALDFLSKHDFTSHPYFTKGGTKYDFESHRKHEPIFVDSHSVNIASGIPSSSLASLRLDAMQTLDKLNQSSLSDDIDPFEEVFLRDLRKLSTRYDVVLKVDFRNATARNPNVLHVLDYGSQFSYFLHSINRTLQTALGNRARAFTIIIPSPSPRSVNLGPAEIPSSALASAVIGLTLDPENAFRLVDHGPAASEKDDSDEAKEFRALWGDKAELRRFKDGSIVESVVWEVTTVEERARIPERIVRHILQLHFGVSDVQVKGFQGDFDTLVRVPPPFVSRIVLPGAQPGYKSALTAFDTLVRLLRSLDTAPPKTSLPTIPLSVLSVSPASQALRYTSTFTPLPLPLTHANSMSPSNRHLPSMDVVIQFERSGKWPDDLHAFQAMKLVFLEEVAACVLGRTADTGLRAGIVFPEGVPTRGASGGDDTQDLAKTYLEIVTPEGWAFSVRVWHDREAILLERALGTKKLFFQTNANAKRNATSLTTNKKNLERALTFYKRVYIHAPRHHRAIASLVHRFTSFSGTVRLVQRWFASHWLLSETPKSNGEGPTHVRTEAVELIVAYVFLVVCGGKEGVPVTKELGFFKFVEFLSRWEWEKGIYAPIYEDNADADARDGLTSTPASFETKTEETVQKKAPKATVKAGSARSGAWTLATREDPEGRMWTESGPTIVIARRLQNLAKAAVKFVDESEKTEIGALEPRKLFVHPTNDYDLLIKLRPEVLVRTHQSILAADSLSESDPKRKYANIPSSREEEDMELRVDYDPVSEFYRDLKRIYAGTLELFFDPFGGSTIGAVWDPNVLKPHPFRVMSDYSSTPVIDVPDGGCDDLEDKANPKAKDKAKKAGKTKETKVELNRAAVLAEIERLGSGIVQAIEVRRA